MKSSVPESAQCRSSNTIATSARLRHALEERAPGGEQLLGAGRLGADAEQRQQRGLDPAPLLLVRDVLADGLGDPCPRCRLVVVRGQAGAAADHLAQRPERDPLAVRRANGRCATRPARGRRRRTSGTPSRAGSCRCRPGPSRSPGGPRFSRPVAWKSSFRSRISSSRPTNGASSASDRPRPPRSATTRMARQAGTGADLPFSVLFAGGLERDRRAGGAHGRLADEDRRRAPRPIGACDAVLTRSPATMPWFVAPSVTAASPVSTPARAWIPGPKAANRVDQLERGPHGCARRRPPGRSALPRRP